jgi:hypothetical protein
VQFWVNALHINPVLHTHLSTAKAVPFEPVNVQLIWQRIWVVSQKKLLRQRQALASFGLSSVEKISTEQLSLHFHSVLSQAESPLQVQVESVDISDWLEK